MPKWLKEFDQIAKAHSKALLQTGYEPTGVQEDIIKAVGTAPPGKRTIILTIDPNKVGKTGTGANIIKNIVTPYDTEWFDYPNFREWPFPVDGRIAGTAKNTADSGPIRRELLKWFPVGAFEAEKSGKTYHSEYQCAAKDASWDVMTYNQEAEEFEGPLLGWTWYDEPPPASIMGATMSRFAHGGILLITATMVGGNVGALLDALEDLEQAGANVIILAHDIEESCTEHGRPNHKGTKRGLLTHEECEDFIATCPKDEVDARAHGQISHKSGKIYPDFDASVHVRDIDLGSELLTQCNTYMVQDPSPKYYPAMQWWARTPGGMHICYNEWPTFTLLGAWYDEVRRRTPCPYAPEDLARFIRLMDGTGHGLGTPKRIMDPWLARASQGEFGHSTESLMELFVKAGLEFELAPHEHVATQRDKIRGLLRWDKNMALGVYNEPRILIASHCLNTRRCFERHYWQDGKEREAEQFKDFIDTARLYFAYLGDDEYDPMRTGAVEHGMAPAATVQNVIAFPGTNYDDVVKETSLV